MNNNYEIIIGLEVHAQLSTKTKIFCSCKNRYGDKTNSNVCPVCLGYPGVLPVLNSKVLDYGLKIGLATNCKIAEFSRFARKNYFYPDLPKGYQITQWKRPICFQGQLKIHPGGIEKTIRIKRIHLEEDAGKSIHARENRNDTLIDYNRSGVPLVEIVTECDMRSSEEAILYLKKLKQNLEYLEISNCNMEEGSFRCDANISMRLKGETKLGTRTELKNMNSFSNILKAINYEVERQTNILENRGNIKQETMLWDENKKMAVLMRTKEDFSDYRYFPEPDLPILRIDEFKIQELKKSLPEFPDDKLARFKNEYRLNANYAQILTANVQLADYFENVVKISKNPDLSSKWIVKDIAYHRSKLNNSNISFFPINEERLGNLLIMVQNKNITAHAAKIILKKMVTNPEPPESIARTEDMILTENHSQTEDIIKSFFEQNNDLVLRYKSGEVKLTQYFMGQVIKKTSGKENPDIIKNLIKKLLED